MVQTILIVIAICMDAFAASLAYGTSKITIPWKSATVISLVGTAFLGISMIAATLLQQLITPAFCTALSFSILFLMGLSSLFQSTFKAYLRKREGYSDRLHFNYADIGFVLEIYLDETKADRDQSKNLSMHEAFYLAMALSMDSLFMGLGSGFGMNNHLRLLVLCFITGLIAVKAGCGIGKKISTHSKLNFSWMSGVILILLASMRLF